MVEDRGHEDTGKSAAAFLRTVRPFSALVDEEIARISQSVMEQSYPEGYAIKCSPETETQPLPAGL